MEILSKTDYEKIMLEIYQQAKKYEEKPLSEINENEETGLQMEDESKNTEQKGIIQDKINQARLHENILIERSLGKPSIFSSTIKKIIRKMMRFFIIPIVQDQNQFNKEILDILSVLNDQQEEQMNNIKIDNENLTQEYKSLNAYLNRDIVKEFERSKQRCLRLEKENTELRQAINKLKKG